MAVKAQEEKIEEKRIKTPEGGRFYRRWVLVNSRIVGGCGVVLFALMLLVVSNAVARAGAKWSIPSDTAIGSIMLVVLTFLAISHVQQQGAHVRVELLERWLSPRRRDISELFVIVLGSLFLALLTWYSVSQALISLSEGEYDQGALDISLWPARLTLAIGFGLATIQFLYQAVFTARRLFPKARIK